MPRPRKAAREEIMTETRQRLLEAATVEFAREGYVGANINRISQTAGFAKGTIYNHFAGKRALMLALIDEVAAAHVDFIVRQVQLEEDPTRRLERFFSAGYAFVEERPARASLIINTVYGPDEEFKERVFEAYGELFTLIMQDIVAAGVAQGHFRSVDPDLAAALLMSIYLGSCSLLQSDGKVGMAPGQVAAFVLDGLCRRDPSPGSEEGNR
jgi:AcrR family transcriptional regulator